MALGVVAVVLLALGLAELTDDVLEHDTAWLDRTILLALRENDDPSDPIGPRWMHEVGRDITALGGGPVLALLTGIVLGYLWARGRWRAGWVLAAGFVGSFLWTAILKAAIDRPRPRLVTHLTEVSSASFPSGHSAMSAATYLALGMLLARAHEQRRVKVYLVCAMAFVVFLVGVSRVYMGVHWPTDVLAGWALGTLWAIAIWTLAWWLESRRATRRSS